LSRNVFRHGRFSGTPGAFAALSVSVGVRLDIGRQRKTSW
jgi:hypothetical protein